MIGDGKRCVNELHDKGFELSPSPMAPIIAAARVSRRCHLCGLECALIDFSSPPACQLNNRRLHTADGGL